MRCKPYGRPVADLLQPLLAGRSSRDPLRVVDLTYGRGRMWSCIEQQIWIVAFDVFQWPWEVTPNWFKQDVAWNWWKLGDFKAEIVAVDPPWAMGKRGREAYGRAEFQYLVGNVNAILRAAEEAARYYNALLLAHWREPWVPRGWRIAGERWTRTNIYGHPTKSWWGLLEREDAKEVSNGGGLQAVPLL